GYCFFFSSTISRHKRDVSSTFALSTEQSFPRRKRANSNAFSTIRSISSREYTHVSIAPASVFLRGSPKYSPPVNSRTIIKSTFSATSRFNGEDASKLGNAFTGRKFANKSKCLRIFSKPFSGRNAGGLLSHFGPPTAPNKMASLASHIAIVSSGNGLLYWSIAAPPIEA